MSESKIDPKAIDAIYANLPKETKYNWLVEFECTNGLKQPVSGSNCFIDSITFVLFRNQYILKLFDSNKPPFKPLSDKLPFYKDKIYHCLFLYFKAHNGSENEVKLIVDIRWCLLNYLCLEILKIPEIKQIDNLTPEQNRDKFIRTSAKHMIISINSATKIFNGGSSIEVIKCLSHIFDFLPLFLNPNNALVCEGPRPNPHNFLCENFKKGDFIILPISKYDDSVIKSILESEIWKVEGVINNTTGYGGNGHVKAVVECKDNLIRYDNIQQKPAKFVEKFNGIKRFIDEFKDCVHSATAIFFLTRRRPENVTKDMSKQLQSLSLESKQKPVQNPVIEPPLENWDCKDCTFSNNPNFSHCELCSKPKPTSNSSSPLDNPKYKTWKCEICTFINTDFISYCEMCRSAPPYGTVIRKDGGKSAKKSKKKSKKPSKKKSAKKSANKSHKKSAKKSHKKSQKKKRQ